MSEKTLIQLKEICRTHGLKVSGTKAQLLERVKSIGSNGAAKKGSCDSLTFSDLPNDVISNVIYPHLEFCDLKDLADVNKAMRSLLCDSLHIVVRDRPVWEQQHFFVWASRYAPKETYIAFTKAVTVGMWERWACRQSYYYLAERGYKALIPAVNMQAFTSYPIWDAARQILASLHSKHWLIVSHALPSLLNSMSRSSHLYLGELLARSLSKEEVKEMFVLNRKEPAIKVILRVILLSYIDLEQYDKYNYILGDQEKKLRTAYARLLLPDISADVYTRISGLRVSKTALGNIIYNRKLYRSLTDEMIASLDCFDLFYVCTPEEAYQQLTKQQKLNYNIEHRPHAYGYEKWATALAEIAGVASKLPRFKSEQ